jgi:hypothetical protein
MNAHFRPHRPAGIAAVFTIVALLSCGDGPVETTPPPPPPPANRTLTVQVDGFGEGRVTSNVGGIDCRTGGAGTCSATVQHGTVVTLTGTADAGFAFGGWSQACSGAGACTVTVNADATVGARFDNPRLRFAQIGPAGGVLQSADGSLTLTVPAGALGAATTLTVEEIGTTDVGPEFGELEDDGLSIRRAYRFGPAGTAFAQPATVTVVSDQTPIQIENGLEFATELLFTSTAGQFEGPSTIVQEVDVDGVRIRGELAHFTTLVRASSVEARRRFSAQAEPVPDVFGTGRPFEVRVTAVVSEDEPGPAIKYRGFYEAVSASYVDRSVAPIEYRGSTTILDVEQKALREARFAGIFPYACADEPGQGTYRAAVMVRIPFGITGRSFATVTLELEKRVDCVKFESELEALGTILLAEPPAATAANDNTLATVGTGGRLDVARIGEDGGIQRVRSEPGVCPGPPSSGFSAPIPGFADIGFLFLKWMFKAACLASDGAQPPAALQYGYTPGYGAPIPGTGGHVVTKVDQPVGMVVYLFGPTRGILLPSVSCPGRVIVTLLALAIIINRANAAPGGEGPCGPPGATVVDLNTNQVKQRAEFGTDPKRGAISRDGSRLVVTDGDKLHVLGIDAAGKLEYERSWELGGSIGGVVFLGDNRLVAFTLRNRNTVAVIDILTGLRVAEVDSGGQRPFELYAFWDFILAVIHLGKDDVPADIRTFRFVPTL